MRNKKQEIRYTISQIADELDISTRTIRFYEEKGLIKPNRTSGNQRIYTPRNKARLKLILRGKRFGFSLEEIAEMIGMTDTDVNEIVQIEKSLKFGDAKLKEIQDRKRELTLLEQDMLATKEKLIRRLNEINMATDSQEKARDKKDFSDV
jgi:DNA-binding transcriptional MerR regulator